MTSAELSTLHHLLIKLRGEREKEIVAKDPEMQQVFDDNDLDAIYEVDDCDRLIEGVDIVVATVEEMWGK